jgi:hypothetical protein
MTVNFKVPRVLNAKRSRTNRRACNSQPFRNSRATLATEVT